MNEEDEPFWRDIIGDKIICSECKNRDKNAFKFGVWSPGVAPDRVWIECKKCRHSGDYNPTKEEVHIFEALVKRALEKQVKEKYGENPPISNIEVESVWHNDDE